MYIATIPIRYLSTITYKTHIHLSLYSVTLLVVHSFVRALCKVSLRHNTDGADMFLFCWKRSTCVTAFFHPQLLCNNKPLTAFYLIPLVLFFHFVFVFVFVVLHCSCWNISLCEFYFVIFSLGLLHVCKCECALNYI